VRLVCPVGQLVWECPSSAPVPGDGSVDVEVGVEASQHLLLVRLGWRLAFDEASLLVLLHRNVGG